MYTYIIGVITSPPWAGARWRVRFTLWVRWVRMWSWMRGRQRKPRRQAVDGHGYSKTGLLASKRALVPHVLASTYVEARMHTRIIGFLCYLSWTVGLMLIYPWPVALSDCAAGAWLDGESQAEGRAQHCAVGEPFLGLGSLPLAVFAQVVPARRL